jgi:hypothetical protein
MLTFSRDVEGAPMKKFKWTITHTAILGFLAGCGGGAVLSPAAAKNLMNARVDTGLAYQHTGAESVEGQEVRAAYCAVSKVLADYGVDAGADDSGIKCKR